MKGFVSAGLTVLFAGLSLLGTTHLWSRAEAMAEGASVVSPGTWGAMAFPFVFPIAWAGPLISGLVFGPWYRVTLVTGLGLVLVNGYLWARACMWIAVFLRRRCNGAGQPCSKHDRTKTNGFSGTP